VDEGTEEEEEEESEGEEVGGFNEESVLEGSFVGGDGLDPGFTQSFLEAEDAELDGRAQDMRDLGIERDLDEDIPEAGSYEHTDTEEEDESEEDEAQDEENEENDEEVMNSSFTGGGNRRRSGYVRRSGTGPEGEVEVDAAAGAGFGTPFDVGRGRRSYDY
jgi:hypothetical protein